MFSKRSAFVRGLEIGGGAPVRIQTMYDSGIDDADPNEVLRRITLLGSMGAELIRFSYVSSKDYESFKTICEKSPIPVVADIHFDYKMALEAVKAGADKIRINPGNIGPKWKTEEVVKACKDKGIAIRIGLNSGSLPRNDKGLSKPELMAETALEYVSWFESWGFCNTVISLKSSSPDETMAANRLLKAKCDYPIHIGVTEAGGILTSSVRSSWALGNLLKEGIGDTIRVSISGDIEAEVLAASEILRTVGLRDDGVRIVACPRCGRHQFDSMGFLSEVERVLSTIRKNITVAIMGCQVNGPGEARNADVAVTGIGNKNFLYVKGKLYKEVDRKDAKEELLKAIGTL